MSFRTAVVAAILALFLVGSMYSAAHAGGSYKREPDFSDSVDNFYSTALDDQNRQKFLSILIFVVLGGGCVYAEMRGIKKLASGD
jgi:hypothetical protein